MLRLKLKKLNKIKKLPRILAGHAFLTSLILILISLILGSLVFYKYSILVERKKPEALEKHLPFNEKTLQEILEIWKTRQKNFEEADLKVYPNPFTPTP